MTIVKVMKRVQFANSTDPDMMAQNEPPNLRLHCLPSSVWIYNIK